MKTLQIYVDFAAAPDVLKMLQEGASGHRLVYARKPAPSVLVQAEREAQFASVDVAFGQPDLQAITEARQLKWIHVSSSGITRYDTPEFRAQMARRRIVVTNSATVYREACADHALSFILAQARNLPRALATRVLTGAPLWQSLRNSCVPLRGATTLILGFGAIGRRLVELLGPYDMKMIAYRRHATGDEGVPVIAEGHLASALGQADHVVNILPDNAASRNFFDARRFAEMKPGAVFYNIGRGTTVDQSALSEALRSGRLAAAWLDVTDPEPLPDAHPLWSQSNCFITPHIAGGHLDEGKTLVAHFLQNLRRFVAGEPLLDRVM